MATAQINERMAALTAAGTSVWLDQIRRSLIEDGELQRLVEEDSLRGVTSNPSIFEKAILGSEDYDDQIRELAEKGLDREQLYEEIAVHDVGAAADVLRGVSEQSHGKDGFVSLEVAPLLAHDTEATLTQARDFWRRLDRRNVMIKIPGTEAGVPAIEQAIYEGINVNVTLLFSVESYETVAEAYIRGLERRLDEGLSLDVHSVASFFVSRVDTEVDKRLKELGSEAEKLRGLAAVANARAAYARFKELFYGERFRVLREHGAHVQRPLWASTGVKDPSYPDTKYVDELVAPDTVNTMPMATLLACADHSHITGATADQDPGEDLRRLADAGIDMGDVTKTLLKEGIDAFVTPMKKLLEGIEAKREAIVTRRPPTIDGRLPQELQGVVADKIAKAAEAGVARRLWQKDVTLWGPEGTPEIANRLGWLTIVDAMVEQAEDLREFARACAADGLTDAVLLGMGGSSLAPEVLRQTHAAAASSSASSNGAGALRLQVLDSTDPAAILAVQESIDPTCTLFLVSTKSGGTVETLSLFAHFHALVGDRAGAEQAGRHFAAITDPGSSLVALAEQHGFRRTFLNDPDIGGRYSALSYFGLVPAALMGFDIAALLDRAGVAEQTSVSYDSSDRNAGLWLGVALSALAGAGRDKLTFVVDPPLASFGLWAEQLVAESTGKQGRGLLPVADEPLGPVEAYGPDRVFVHLRDAQNGPEDVVARMAELADAGHPVLTVATHGPADLGRIFFIAELGTAVAGWGLGINPFDQPNVQQAKDATKKVLAGYESEHRLPEVPDAGDEQLRALLAGAGPPHYVAVMAYAAFSDELEEAVAGLRSAIRGATQAATTFGYGPRFLHSTGQFHKGGPKVGRFLQLVHDGQADLEIPGAPYSFTTLKNAQATGDLNTLRELGLPAERVRLQGPDAAAAIRELTERVRGLI